MQTTLTTSAGTFSTRLLTPPDLPALQALFERGADYFEIATGRAPVAEEAQRAFVAGPPAKDVNDKRIIGVFSEGDTLVGVLDALTDWPDRGVWTMGMLLLDPSYRGGALGTAALAAYEAWAQAQGAHSFQTALVSHHERGLRFLERAGYERTTTLDQYDAGGCRPTVFFFAKRVSPGGTASPRGKTLLS